MESSFVLMDLFTFLWGSNPSPMRHVIRKVPIRVEPKSFYSNERTFLGWLRMAVALGGVSAAILGWQQSNQDERDQEADEKLLVSQSTIRTIYTCMLPLSIMIIFYAMFVFSIRRKSLKTKRVTYFYNDQYGPLVITSLVIGVLIAIYGSILKDIVRHTS